MSSRSITIALALVLMFAICTPARPNTLSSINNSALRQYTEQELERGAPSMGTTSRILYREALQLLERGEWETARERLLLAAELSGDYADPLFTLARVELMHAHPDFLIYLVDGINRLARNYRSQSLIALNTMFLLVVSALGALLVILVTLLMKYWPLIDHKLREGYRKKAAFPPASWIGLLIIIGFLFMRLGIALYSVILVIALWPLATRKEKGVVATLVILVAAISFASGYINILVPAIDPGSITGRLALISERGADERTIKRIREINDPAFYAEKEFVLGTSMYRLNYLEEARRHFLTAVSKRKDFAPAYLNLGNVYFKQGDYDKAIAGYQSVIALDSTNALAHFNIGQTYIKKMLFAESSSMLKRANTLGIEKYRESHPAVTIRGLTIYEAELSTRELWSIAYREGRAHPARIFSEVLQPYLLFPFHRLWILLAVTMVMAAVVGKRIPKSWRAFRCDNCSMAACPECASSETGLHLCKSCASTIDGLTSVKVMEALLRHRRQKMSTKTGTRSAWRFIIFPGAPCIGHGKTTTGMVVALLNVGALMLLICNGFYFKDPQVIVLSTPLWKYIVPPVFMLLSWVLSARARVQSESRNYRILPAEMHIDRQGSKQAGGGNEAEKKSEQLEALLNSL
ncbi:MAG: tetratricopeptide repeat protein [bacterium]|nr:MAG: tetratricopeptide repeat protein [bacterium]